MSSLDVPTRSKIKIIHADVADCNLLKLFAAAPRHDTVLLFCNNLAMPPGARDRQAKQFAGAQQEHTARVVVVSAVPLAAGFGDDAGKESCYVDGDDRSSQREDHAPHPLRRSLGIGMTFNDCHEVRVYEDGSAAEKASKGSIGGRQEEDEECWGDIDSDAVGADSDSD